MEEKNQPSAINMVFCGKDCGRLTKNSHGICAECMRLEATGYFLQATNKIKGGNNSAGTNNESN